MDEQPEDSLTQLFDLVVIGTDTTNAIIAGAAARAGKKVLHLDSNPFYGGASATLNLTGFRDYLLGEDREKSDANDAAQAGEFNLEFNTIHNVDITQFPPSPIPVPPPAVEPPVVSSEEKVDAVEPTAQDVVDAPAKTEESTQSIPAAAAAEELAVIRVEAFEELIGQNRQYNIDLAPKLCQSDGALVRLLVSSGVHKYTEFKVLESTLIAMDDGLHVVPCSKGEIFQSKIISVMEKRVLMRFMQSAAEGSLSTEGSFLNLLRVHNLSERLQKFVLHAIVFSGVADELSAAEGVGRLQSYINSTGRFGESAHLWPFYGVSEISQAFCRLSAVYGGIYLLRCGGTTSLRTLEDGNVAIHADKDKDFRAKHVIIASYLASSHITTEDTITRNGAELVARCVCVTSTSLMPNKGIVLCVLPPETCGNSRAVYVQQLDFSAQACPKGKYLWMMWTGCDDSESGDALARAKLETSLDWIVGKVQSAGQEVVMHWSAFYLQGALTTRSTPNSSSLPANVTVIPCTSSDVEIDGIVDVAKRAFSQLYPGEEFLPTIPNPEDADEQQELAEAHAELQRRENADKGEGEGAEIASAELSESVEPQAPVQVQEDEVEKEKSHQAESETKQE